MKPTKWIARLAAASALTACAGAAFAQPGAPAAGTLLGTNCNAPPVYHCPDASCESPVVTQPGNTVEMKSRRTYFLDCPAGYKCMAFAEEDEASFSGNKCTPVVPSAKTVGDPCSVEGGWWSDSWYTDGYTEPPTTGRNGW